MGSCSNIFHSSKSGVIFPSLYWIVYYHEYTMVINSCYYSLHSQLSQHCKHWPAPLWHQQVGEGLTLQQVLLLVFLFHYNQPCHRQSGPHPEQKRRRRMKRRREEEEEEWPTCTDWSNLFVSSTTATPEEVAKELAPRWIPHNTLPSSWYCWTGSHTRSTTPCTEGGKKAENQ